MAVNVDRVMQVLWTDHALLADGWQRGVRVVVRDDGRIGSVTAESAPEGDRLSILLPSPANLHSHAFQRAMAGLTEARGPDPQDSFWTWRQLMYRFLDRLTPDDVEAIAAFVQMEMLEAGYAAVGEFHYLHHAPDGAPFDRLAEMSDRIIAAAAESGIGLTLLPVLYRWGGCDRRALGPGQVRFGNDLDRFARLHVEARQAIAALPHDARIGIAPHSLRAVDPASLAACLRLAGDGPIHMHLAEQAAEVEEVAAAWGRRPVEWLLENADPDGRWCLIHCTQMQPHETEALAATGTVAGLCPITEFEPWRRHLRRRPLHLCRRPVWRRIGQQHPDSRCPRNSGRWSTLSVCATARAPRWPSRAAPPGGVCWRMRRRAARGRSAVAPAGSRRAAGQISSRSTGPRSTWPDGWGTP